MNGDNPDRLLLVADPATIPATQLVADEDQAERAAAEASARCEFQLTYARSPVRREFSPGWLDGPDLPDAYREDETASGAWMDGDALYDGPTTANGWIDRYAAMAINEVVHEGLEWMRVDGRPWLDPHGASERLIYEAVNELCMRLAELRHAEAAPPATGMC